MTRFWDGRTDRRTYRHLISGIPLSTIIILLLARFPWNNIHTGTQMATPKSATAVAQSVRAFASHAEVCCLIQSRNGHNYVNTSSDSSTAKLETIGVSVTGPPR